MLNSLYSRLALALVLVLLLVGAIFSAASWYVGKQHADLVVQTFNKDLAGNLIRDHNLIVGGELDKRALKDTFNDYMQINPSIEIYLLDSGGRILSFSAPSDEVILDHVSLAPIREFLGNKKYKPVLGTDPRSTDRGKAFSVAPINTNAGMFGYLYIVLRGEAFDSVENALQHQYFIKLSLYALMVSLIIGLFAGLSVLWLVTRRLRRLTRKVQAFQSPGFTDKVEALMRRRRFRGDEIDKLASAFAVMSHRITKQIHRLKDNDRRRRDLIANVSHDLRTPLTAMLGYLDTLQSKIDTLDARQRDDCIETALRNARRLSMLIDDLFELAKLEGCNSKIAKESFSIRDLVQDVVHQQLVLAHQNKVTVSVDAPRRLPLAVGDIAMIQRVLENLILNAIEHADEIGQVIVRLREADNHIEISVWDSGAQIDSVEVPHLFDRYYRGNTRDESTPGTGLGLSIAKQILSLHESSIEVRNRSSGGKEFSFTLQAA